MESDQMVNQNRQLVTKISELNDQKSKLVSELSEANDDFSRRLEGIKRQLTEKSDEYEILTKNFKLEKLKSDDFMSKNKDLEAKLSIEKTKLSDALQKIDIYKNEVDPELQSTKNEMHHLTEKHSNLQKNYENYKISNQNNLENLEVQIENLLNEKRKLKTIISDQDIEIEELTRLERNAVKNYNQKDMDYISLENDLDAANNELEDLRSKLLNLNNSQSKLKMDLESTVSDLKSLENEYSLCKEKMRALEYDSTEKYSKLSTKYREVLYK